MLPISGSIPKRLKSEAEEQAHLKAEEEARIDGGLRLKDKAEEEARFSEELRLRDEKEEQERLKAEENTRLSEELRPKAEA